VVFGISNGGLAFADLLKRIADFRCPLVSLWRENPTEDFDNAVNAAVCDGIKQHLSSRSQAPKLLVIDDNIATGGSAIKAMRYLQAKFQTAHLSFVPLCYKGNNLRNLPEEYLLWKQAFADPKLSEGEIKQMHHVDYSKFPYQKDVRE
jgi:uracil phosphoribosyltransferase